MKRLLVLFVVAFGLMGCEKINQQFAEINSRLDKIENNTIASINQQISSINNSINLLQDTDKEIKGYITNLQTVDAELQKSLNTTNEKIDATKKDLEQGIATAKSEALAELETARAAIYGEIGAVNETIDQLKQKDSALEQSISDLQSYVNTELSKTKDWASATFATLQQYQAITEQISSINGLIEGINKSMVELESRINDKIASDIATSISKAKEELTAAYETAIQASILASENSMKDWVNSQLSGYYTIAQADAKSEAMMITINKSFAAQRNSLDSLATAMSAEQKRVIDSLGTAVSEAMASELALRDKEITTIKTSIQDLDSKIVKNKVSIDSLKTALEGAKKDITDAYTAAIATAIGELEGKLDDITEAKVVAINKSIVDGINARLDNLEGDMSTVKTNIATIFSDIETIYGRLDVLRADVDSILASVQSIVVVPDYSDGSVTLLKPTPTENEYRFEVLPKSAAEKLVSMGKSLFTFKAVYTAQTKASIGDFVTLPISQVKYEDGLVKVKVDASSVDSKVYYWKNGISLNGRLSISNGYTDLSSEYFAMKPVVPGAVDLGVSVYWATSNLGADSPTEEGEFYCWGLTEATEPYPASNPPFPLFTNPDSLPSIAGTQYDACTAKLGEGWQIPTLEEWQELINNCDSYKINNIVTLIGPNGNSISFVQPDLLPLFHTATAYITGTVNGYYATYFYNSTFRISDGGRFGQTYRIRPIYK